MAIHPLTLYVHRQRTKSRQGVIQALGRHADGQRGTLVLLVAPYVGLGDEPTHLLGQALYLVKRLFRVLDDQVQRDGIDDLAINRSHVQDAFVPRGALYPFERSRGSSRGLERELLVAHKRCPGTSSHGERYGCKQEQRPKGFLCHSGTPLLQVKVCTYETKKPPTMFHLAFGGG